MTLSARSRGILRAGGIAAILATTTLTRLWSLDRPGELVFDETYYVKDAWTLWNLGYEGSWPDGASELWAAGDPNGYSDAPSFVVHPPLGKWLIALGMAALGADSPWGWRISIAVLGMLLVALTTLAAHLLFRSWPLSLMAGGLMAVDGVAIVLSRVSLLDTALAVFVLIGFCCVVLDRRQTKRLLSRWRVARGGTVAIREWGPVLWRRPWLIAAGLALGLGSGVKWSAFWFIAVLGIAVVLSDVFLFRRAGVESWGRVVIRQGAIDFLLLVPIAFAAYLATWTGWFATEGGYHRNWLADGGDKIGGGDTEAWGGLLAWVPPAFQNWWHFQTVVYGFHTGLLSDHSYRAHPIGWLVLLRPTSMWYREFDDGTAAEIISIGNPLVWWAGTAALVALLVRVGYGLVHRRLVAAEALVLAGLAAGYLPWFLYAGRPTFQFYTVAFLPFLVIALAFWLNLLLGSADDPPVQRRIGIGVVAAFLVAVAGLSIYFWPLWSGLPIDKDYLRAHWWFGSWI